MGVDNIMGKEQKDGSDIGPWGLLNWRAYNNGKPEKSAFEVPLFTDAQITGDIPSGCGPYQFLNTIASGEGTLEPAIVFRASEHLFGSLNDYDLGMRSTTDATQWHGGDGVDEIAALVSLALGIRVRPGATTREFSPGGDPRGRPAQWLGRSSPPVLIKNGRRMVLPSASGTVYLGALAERLSNYSSLSAPDVVFLIRAARLYQNSLWISESQPELAWLFLVAAVETAENQWNSNKASASARLAAARPDLVNYLNEIGGNAAVDRVAAEFADSLGATEKFRAFLLAHLPDEPKNRPKFEWGRVDWAESSLRKSFGKIYGYRSKALHEGTPFPMPMCEGGMKLIDEDQSVIFTERPPSSGYAIGSWWDARDLPMYYWVFEYIARGAMLNWWSSLEAQVEITPSA